MESTQADMDRALMLDGNAAGGLLQEIFAEEMTASPTECASCGREGELGALLAFTQAPGVVLRCPNCSDVGLRVATLPDQYVFELRGAWSRRIEP